LLWIALAIGCSVTVAAAEPVRVTQAGPALLPPHEVATIVRSAGFTPISPAARRGDRYVLRVSAPDGREMRVVVHARRGEIISAVPVVPAAAGVSAERPSPHEPMAPGYVPLGPPEVYESEPPVVYEGDRPLIYERRPMEPIPNASSRGARAVVPDERSSAEPSVAMREEGAERGMLPPPPERFPSRALPPAPKPAAKPVPAKRAATAIPATPPLPKPRPAAEGSTPAAAPQDTDGKPDPRALPH
jgi:hypothetical protein